MANTSNIRVRRSIVDILNDHSKGITEPLDKLVRAWDGIQKLPPDHDNSFFKIAGYHGEPFRGAGWGNAAWWGGFCNHGNVLFPTWHRAYLLRLEDALRSIDGCGDVTLPYWNEVGLETLSGGVPRIFLDTEYTFSDNKKTIRNPLHSYVFQKSIFDNLSQIPDADYSKPAEYQTVRYPFSGLVGTEKDSKKTKAYNEELTKRGKAVTDKMLNDNVSSWLNESITNSDGNTILTRTSWKYRQCLHAENYTVFSNTTSATQWNQDKFGIKNAGLRSDVTVPLESPHNDIHLAVGGFSLPNNSNVDSPGAADANGDMGENNTASFDPIFYFHHCFIDKVFWTWQQIKNSTDKLEIIDKYPGTNSIDSQGPTPGVPGNSWLTMKTPLDPFVKDGKPLTSEGVVNIEKQLNYRYEAPRLKPKVGDLPQEIVGGEPELQSRLGEISEPNLAFPDPSSGGERRGPQPPPKQITGSTPILDVYGVNRAAVSGSFLLEVFGKDGKLLGVESVLSRRNVAGCANCQNHLQVKAFIPLLGRTEDNEEDVVVRVETRETKPPPGLISPTPPERLRPRFRFVPRPDSSLPSREA